MYGCTCPSSVRKLVLALCQCYAQMLRQPIVIEILAVNYGRAALQRSQLTYARMDVCVCVCAISFRGLCVCMYVRMYKHEAEISVKEPWFYFVEF